MLKRLLKHPRTHALGARMIGRYLAFAFRTTRWELVGLRDDGPHGTVENEIRARRPVAVSFWHERLPMMSMLWRAAERIFPEARGRSPHVLVSRHRDGRFIGDVVERFGFTMVHGSTSRGGAAGMSALLRALEGGYYAAITPDGPRGPRRVANEGVAQLAGLARLAVIPTAAATRRHRLLPSWDRMMLPLPFTRGVLVCGAPVRVSPEDTAAGAALISEALNEACRLADSWVEGREAGVASRRV